MKYEGYSFPLCDKIVETLEKSNRKFEIQTLHILGNNTRQDSEGNAYPIFSGFVVSILHNGCLIIHINGDPLGCNLLSNGILYMSALQIVLLIFR